MGQGQQGHAPNAPVSGGYGHDCSVDTFSFGAALAGRDKDIDQLPSSRGPKVVFSNANSPADLLFSNGQIQPHTFFPFDNKGPLDHSPRISYIANNRSGSSSSSSSSSRSNSSRRNLHQGSQQGPSINSHKSSPKRPSDPAQAKVRSTPLNAYLRQAPASKVKESKLRITDILGHQESKIKNPTKTRPVRAQETSGQGKGLFRSFLTACRECHALEPTSQVDRLPGKIGVHS